jgi:hypothetical protein
LAFAEQGDIPSVAKSGWDVGSQLAQNSALGNRDGETAIGTVVGRLQSA